MKEYLCTLVVIFQRRLIYRKLEFEINLIKLCQY
jgi:hypothetical protein